MRDEGLQAVHSLLRAWNLLIHACSFAAADRACCRQPCGAHKPLEALTYKCSLLLQIEGRIPGAAYPLRLLQTTACCATPVGDPCTLPVLLLQIEGRMPGAAYPLRMLQTISGHLRERGFRGNSEDYYDPGG